MGLPTGSAGVLRDVRPEPDLGLDHRLATGLLIARGPPERTPITVVLNDADPDRD
jgi:hypothetical protein